MVLKLYVGNTTYVDLQGLRDGNSGSYLNAATVTATLLDKAGAEVAGATWPVTLSYVGASNGNYLGILPDTVDATINCVYTLNVHVVSGSLIADFNFRTVAEVRTS